tara:strand:- start:1658 stop:2743 length:1086 start_codon:yes stop_codon:yes gene_type:complete
MRFSFVFLFVLITVVFFSSESEASEELEENFSITINPGWEYWKETNCSMVTDQNGTYEECDWPEDYEKAYETNITDTDWIISVPLESDFTFTLNGINFSSEVTYKFSYKIFTSGGYSGLPHEIREADYVIKDIEITSSSLIFIRPDINTNSSFSYNLSGKLSSNILINETRGQYLGDCVQIYAIVTLEKSNNTMVEWTKSHTSESFSPGYKSVPFNTDQSDFRKSACWPPVQYQYTNWGISLEEVVFGSVILLLLGLVLYGQATLISWHFTGSYKSKSTQYLAILVSATMFILFFMFSRTMCSFAAIVLFAQFIAYRTGHYDKPEESGDSEEDTKKAIGPYILFGLVFFALLITVLTAAVY